MLHGKKTAKILLTSFRGTEGGGCGGWLSCLFVKSFPAFLPGKKHRNVFSHNTGRLVKFGWILTYLEISWNGSYVVVARSHSIIRLSVGELRWIFTSPKRLGKYPPLLTSTSANNCDDTNNFYSHKYSTCLMDVIDIMNELGNKNYFHKT